MSIVTFSAGIGPQRAAAVEVVGRSSVSHQESAYEGRGQSNTVSSATPRCVIVRERRVSLVT